MLNYIFIIECTLMNWWVPLKFISDKTQASVCQISLEYLMINDINLLNGGIVPKFLCFRHAISLKWKKHGLNWFSLFFDLKQTIFFVLSLVFGFAVFPKIQICKIFWWIRTETLKFGFFIIVLCSIFERLDEE